MLLSAFLGLAWPVQGTNISFKPSEYPKKTTVCQAVRRGKVDEIVDIRLSKLLRYSTRYPISRRIAEHFND